MSSHTDLHAVFAGNNYLINVISVILINTELNIIMFLIMIKKRNLAYDIHQSWDCAIIPTHSKATTTEIHHFNIYSWLFVMYILPFDLGGTCEKIFTLASP